MCMCVGGGGRMHVVHKVDGRDLNSCNLQLLEQCSSTRAHAHTVNI